MMTFELSWEFFEYKKRMKYLRLLNDYNCLSNLSYMKEESCRDRKLFDSIFNYALKKNFF